MTHHILARLLLVLGVAPLAVVACGDDGDSSATQNTSNSCQRAFPASAGQNFCHTVADCKEGAGYICTAVQDYPSCGGGGPGSSVPPSCSSDEACAAQGSAEAPLVCQDQGSYSTCRPPCLTDENCGILQRCQVETGHCKPRTCDEATPCAEGTFCAAGGKCKIKNCVPEDANACGLGQVCDPYAFTCVASPCDTAKDCPELFVCSGGACERKSCACDTECGASGFCIRGQCKESPGVCAGQVACGRPLILAGSAVVAGLARGDAWA